MATLPTRTTASFAAIAPVPNLTVLDNEFNQYVGASGIFNGGTTGTKLLTKASDAADPVYEFDQTGAGPIIECKQNGTLKVHVANSGQIVSAVATGTAPLSIASTTEVANLNAASVGGVVAANIAKLDTHKTAWSITWFYPVLPGAVETVESVGRLLIPAGVEFVATALTVGWAAGTDSAASNIFTIKRRNNAGTLQADMGTLDVNAPAQNALAQTIISVALSTNDQIYPLFTTRNGATEQLVSITIHGKQKFTT